MSLVFATLNCLSKLRSRKKGSSLVPALCGRTPVIPGADHKRLQIKEPLKSKIKRKLRMIDNFFKKTILLICFHDV